MGHKDHGLSGHEAWECKEGGDARHARRRSGREGPKPLTLRALVSSAPVLRGRASNSPMEASSQIAGPACDARTSALAGVSCICVRPDQRETQVQAGVQPCSRGWGMRGARTRDGLLAQVPPSIVMSRSSGIAPSDSRADFPRTTMLMPAHLRGAKQGDGLTGRQWRREWAKDRAKPDSPADRSTKPLEADERKLAFTLLPPPTGESPMCQI